MVLALEGCHTGSRFQVYGGLYFSFTSLQTIVFTMISGQMWNHIRGPPYAHRNPQTGEIVSHIFILYFVVPILELLFILSTLFEFV